LEEERISQSEAISALVTSDFEPDSDFPAVPMEGVEDSGPAAEIEVMDILESGDESETGHISFHDASKVLVQRNKDSGDEESSRDSDLSSVAI
jgi:hypothetical protein